jgi:N-acetyltransferase 10
MGYGARALQALNAYYSGQYFNVDESAAKEDVLYPDTINEACRSTLSAQKKLTFN